MLTSRWINNINYIFYDWQSLFLQVYQSTAKHSYPFTYTEKKIPNKSNSLTLYLTYSLVFSQKHDPFLIYFSSRDGTTLICYLVAQSSCHHQHLDYGYWILWDPVGHFSIRHSIQWQVSCFASVRMTLNRKWSEEKLKLKLILIPSKLFSLIYLILTTRRKNKSFRSRHCQQTTGSPKATVCNGNFKKICQKH